MSEQKIRVDSERAVLIVVDMQPDFLPGGALPVAGGDEILEPTAKLMESNRFKLCVATQDWHPADHVSFASNHPGKSAYDRIQLYGHEQILWPDHCVQGTPGAALHADLPWEWVTAIVRKGTDPLSDSYSGFRNNWDPNGERPRTGLGGYLRDRGIEDVFLCGLTRDFCVKWSSEDAADDGFRVHVLWDLTRSVYPEGDDGIRGSLEQRGVETLTSDRLVS